jgi:hypothetical protein
MQLGSMWHVSFLRVADQSHAPLEIENAASQFNFFWSVRHLSRKNVPTHGQLRTRRKTLEQIMRGKPKSRSTVTLLRLMPIGCRDKPIIFPINPNPHSVGSQHPTRIQPFSSPSCPPFAFFLPPPSFNHNRHSPLPGISPVFFPPKVIKTLSGRRTSFRPNPTATRSCYHSPSSLLFVYSRSFLSFYIP